MKSSYCKNQLCIPNKGQEKTEFSAGYMARQKDVEEHIIKLHPSWKTIENAILQEDVVRFSIPASKLLRYKELCVEAEIIFADNTKGNQSFMCGKNDATTWQCNMDTTVIGKGYFLMNISKNIDGKRICWDGTFSACDNTIEGTSYTSMCNASGNSNAYVFSADDENLWFQTTEDNPMAQGTVIKVWAR